MTKAVHISLYFCKMH